MTALTYLNMLACAVIFAWALWCVLDQRINDGIVGKFLLSCVALAAMGVISANVTGYTQPKAPGTLLHVFVALLGVRQAFMKIYWPRIVKRARCAGCPNND